MNSGAMKKRRNSFDCHVQRRDEVVAVAAAVPLALARVRDAKADEAQKRVSTEAGAKERLLKALVTVGDESLENVVVPTLDRLLRGDVQLIDLAGNEGKGLVKAMRTPHLAKRLSRLHLTDEQMSAAVRFASDFEKARIGGLTANYAGGSGKSQAREPERWCEAMDLLSKASTGPLTNPITKDERAALFAYVVLDVSLADLGATLCGSVTGDKNMHVFTGKLYLDKSLNKLVLFYEDWDFVQERHQTAYKSG